MVPGVSAHRPINSLPLMGIGNPIEAAAGTADHQASLPLMGIGNKCTCSPLSSAVNTSLPLMGIGNASSGSIRRIPPSSLPLMGIGNRSPSSGRHRYRSAHYPSWGSETCSRTTAPTTARALITPHGDRKPRHFRGVGQQMRSSLPLMGIGNLITPHGDRKRRGAGRTAAPAAPPHYPSWGSETRI